jgi:hypothetical protein
MLAWAAALLIAGSAAAKPREIVVGAYLNDIQNLDLKTHSYEADVYLWFRWKGDGRDPAASVEFNNPNELWGHARSSAYEKPERLPDGSWYQVLRAQGRFSRKLSLEQYPFDRQVLAVEFEDPKLDSDDLVFVADAPALAVNPDLKLPGFKLAESRLTITDYTYPSSFGDPRRKPNTRYSRVSITQAIERPALAYGVKLILPVLCVIFCASLLFLFHPRYVDARAGIGITALLTVVALQITLNEDLPEVDYLILMDKIYIGAYLFVVGALAMVVRTTKLIDAGKEARALKLDRLALGGMLAAFLAGTAALFLTR